MRDGEGCDLAAGIEHAERLGGNHRNVDSAIGSRVGHRRINRCLYTESFEVFTRSIPTYPLFSSSATADPLSTTMIVLPSWPTTPRGEGDAAGQGGDDEGADHGEGEARFWRMVRRVRRLRSMA